MNEAWCALALSFPAAALGALAVRRGAWPIVACLFVALAAALALAWRGLALDPLFAALLALPLSTVGFTLGAALGALRALPARGLAAAIAVAWCAAAATAGALPAAPHEETIETSRFVAGARGPVFAALEEFGRLTSAPSGLLRFGLPVPVRCELESEAPGARRTCYFRRGHIEQRVLAIDPPARLDLSVVLADVPHLPFAFTGASYRLTEQAGGTLVVRTTSLRSPLRPAAFFRPLERLAVAAEHRYLLDDLAHRFATN